MMKINEVIKQIKSELGNLYDEREAGNIAFLVLEHYLEIPKVKMLASMDEDIKQEVQKKILSAIEALKKHKPVQYVLGETFFFGMKYKVNENVLIPRSETEELVNLILNEWKNVKRAVRILDIGTGSGCIAITLKKNLFNASVHACDISEKALSVASANAINNNSEVEFHQFDILDNAGWPSFQEFDIIVSNPPYIRESEMEFMKKNVLDFEPGLALFVSDNDALLYYRAIAGFSKKYLKKKGCLYLEINEALCHETSELFQAAGFQILRLLKDIHGKDRYICCINP